MIVNKSNFSNNKDLAMIILTGEILEIKMFYKTLKLFYQSNELEVGKHDFKIETSVLDDHNAEYLLSNGNKYTKEELIVGIDNIRDYKIEYIKNKI